MKLDGNFVCVKNWKLEENLIFSTASSRGMRPATALLPSAESRSSRRRVLCNPCDGGGNFFFGSAHGGRLTLSRFLRTAESGYKNTHKGLLNSLQSLANFCRVNNFPAKSLQMPLERVGPMKTHCPTSPRELFPQSAMILIPTFIAKLQSFARSKFRSIKTTTIDSIPSPQTPLGEGMSVLKPSRIQAKFQ